MSIINDEYVTKIQTSLENIPKCPDFGGLKTKTEEEAQTILKDVSDSLAKVSAQIQGFITDMSKAIEDQLAALKPLIEPPTSLTAVLGYLTSIADTFKKPYDLVIAAQVELYQKAAVLIQSYTSAVSSAAACAASAGKSLPSVPTPEIPSSLPVPVVEEEEI